MRKTPEQIQDDKLDSNYRKAKAGRERAEEGLAAAESDPNAGTPAGQSKIKQRKAAVERARANEAEQSNKQLRHETEKALSGKSLPSKPINVL